MHKRFAFGRTPERQWISLTHFYCSPHISNHPISNLISTHPSEALNQLEMRTIRLSFSHAHLSRTLGSNRFSNVKNYHLLTVRVTRIKFNIHKGSVWRRLRWNWAVFTIWQHSQTHKLQFSRCLPDLASRCLRTVARCEPQHLVDQFPHHMTGSIISR